MHLRPELVLLQKTMVQVEGVARNLDPKHDMWAAARPIVASLGPKASPAGAWVRPWTRFRSSATCRRR
jgi:ubiquinone biosynthesis protein